MGLFDRVMGGVREMAIARPPGNADLVFKHPDRTIPMFSQCTVQADEWAVFTREGVPKGTLDAGRHTLQAASIPFLGQLLDQATGGNFLQSEVYFVKRTPFPLRFGGTLGNMIDPLTRIRVRGRTHGELRVQIVNPELLLYGWIGTGKSLETPDPLMFLGDDFKNSVGALLGKIAREQRRTLVDMMDMQNELKNQLMQEHTSLSQLGLRIVMVSKFEFDIDPEDIKRFDEKNEKLADMQMGIAMDEMNIQRAALQAQADAARAQVGVQTAQYQAQAEQFKLDQKFNQDAKYVQQLAGGSYNNYAQGQAMIGAGQGMASGNMGGGAAGQMAQFGVGMGIAQMYSQGMGNLAGQQQGHGPQFVGVVPGTASAPPGMAPPPPPPMNPAAAGAGAFAAAVFHVQLPTGVTQVQGADALRGELQNRGLDANTVMVWTNGMPQWAPAATVLNASAGAPPPPPPPPPSGG